MLTTSDFKAAGALAIAEAWARGRIRWKLDSGQRKWLSDFDKTPEHSSSVWLIGRQRGKSHAALTLAIETLLAKPLQIVRYTALTGKNAAAIVVPTLESILSDCPRDLRPEISEHAGTAKFKNGSVFTWSGTDNKQYERQRGPRCHLYLADEFCFYDDLLAVERAILPQRTTTGGRVLYLSTPPESEGHGSVERIRAAQASGFFQHDTIHSNPRLGAGGVEQIAKGEAERLGLSLESLYASSYWRREYLAEIVTEANRAVVPVWPSVAATATVRKVRPHIFDGYVSVDFGFSPDPSAALFAWLDDGGHLHVESELEVHGRTLSEFAERAKEIERQHWSANRWDGTLWGARDLRATLPEFLERAVSAVAPRQPYLRVGDNAPLVLSELSASHGYSVIPSEKDNKQLAVDSLNQLLAEGRITIEPSCIRLLTQLHTTIWNRQRTAYERTTRDHGDLVDCLVYLVRNLNFSRRKPEMAAGILPGVSQGIAHAETAVHALQSVFGKRFVR